MRTLPWDDLHRDADRFVDDIWGFVPGIGGTLVAANYSRFGIDLNRALDEVDGLAVEGMAGQGYPRGAVWRVTTRGEAALAGPIPRELFDALVERYYRPYHAALAVELASVVRQEGTAILVAAHSMPSVGGISHRDPGKRRPDVVIGNNFGESCANKVTTWVADSLDSAGLSVAINDPYSGGYTTRHYGSRDGPVHAIQIELNRALYMDEAALVVRDLAARRLRKVLESMCASLPQL